MAGTNTMSQIPPRLLASGDRIRRDRNQRVPIMPANNGRRNAPTPKNCSRRSETKAPTMPIQLRAACDPVSTDALLKDGSSGEYEAKARKRRSAETPNKNPTSSLSRRLFVGLKIRETNFIGASPHRRANHTPAAMPEARQSLTIMPRTPARDNAPFGPVSS